jgi:23S rRNA G2069 N7-methylase RlmK/C1962 C5-methylase RlmI
MRSYLLQQETVASSGQPVDDIESITAFLYAPCACGLINFVAITAHVAQVHVTSVDIGKNLAAVADSNVRLNQFDSDRHTFVTADCFDVLHRYAQEQKIFDIVILDPPTFAKSKQNRFAAIRAYTKLNALALKCVAPNGLLVSASCTSQVSPEAFKEMLASAAALSDRRIQILHAANLHVFLGRF